MKPNFIEALQQLERGKRMSKETVREIVESALLSAARKSLGVTPERVEVACNEASGEMNVVVRKTVAAGKPASADEISLDEARKINAGAAVGDEVAVKIALDDLGRIAAQTAKHIVLQRVREEERTTLYDEFKNKVGKAMTCLVKQRRGKLVILDLGDVEAVLPGSEQIPKEDYRAGEHLKVYVAEVSNTPRGPHIIASRNRPELIKYLFEQEVPEVTRGIVEIMAVAREPGSRSKIAVRSHDRNVDPVGACIGMKGMRVQAVVQELHGEKMDVVSWDEDPETFLMNSLSPAKPTRVIKNEETKTMIAVAADHNQLVHLIGRGGQNARLASSLTGWKVEIMTEADLKGGDTAPAEATATAENAPAGAETTGETPPAPTAESAPASAETTGEAPPAPTAENAPAGAETTGEVPPAPTAESAPTGAETSGETPPATIAAPAAAAGGNKSEKHTAPDETSPASEPAQTEPSTPTDSPASAAPTSAEKP